MGTINEIIAFLSKNPDIMAAVFGLALSWCGTQWIKKLIPAEWSDGTYRRVIQVVGFVFGWIFTLGAWQLLDPTSTHLERLYYSAGIGFASPALYSLIVPWVSTKWPFIGKALSGRPIDGA